MKSKKLKKNKFVKMSKSIKTEKKAQAASTVNAPKNKRLYNLVRGMHDILPKDEKYWQALYHTAENLANSFQFSRIETPVLEEAGLYVRSIGKGTDVVEKEMYVFEDRDGERLALRPEPTAGIVRAYLTHGLWNVAQPVKVWTWGPMFRHDRPQAGRYRQFHQFDFETLGVKDPVVDAEMILVAYNMFKDLGMPTTVHINTLGTKEERSHYLAELVSYYRAKRAYLCEDCKARLGRNPLRLLDCKAEQCQPVKEAAPQILDWLEDSSKNYFMKVLEYLDELGIPYLLTPSLVRGLDYYTHTVFELYPQEHGEEGSQSALCGGGRYDLLVEELGGPPTPAIGFGLGVERAVTALKQYGEQHPIKIPETTHQIFFAQLGEEGRRRSLKIIDELRNHGLKIAFNFFKNSLKNQLEVANNLKVPYVLILGQKEVQDKTVIIRDMESGVQEIIDQKKIEAALKKKLNLS